MADVSIISASVTMDGTVNYVTRNSVTHAATITVNARTELVYASPDGTESTAHLKAAQWGMNLSTPCPRKYLIYNNF